MGRWRAPAGPPCGVPERGAPGKGAAEMAPGPSLSRRRLLDQPFILPGGARGPPDTSSQAFPEPRPRAGPPLKAVAAQPSDQDGRAAAGGPPPAMPVALLLALAVLAIGLILGPPRLRAWRRRAWAARPFPPAWRSVLRRRVPLYRALPAPLQQQLRRHVLVFLAEKPFVGCAGLKVTDEMRVTIAAHACLLRLNRGGPLFPALHRVLVYPGSFVVDRVHAAPGGVLREQRQALAGESWSQGQVILSWSDVLAGARVADDGHNVALHEFAHQLDQESGSGQGAPRQDDRAAQARWARVMQAEFDALQARLRARDAGLRDPLAPPELIGDYGATSPAEFFAVVTEVFFERAAALAGRHPALFAALRDYFRVDPREWHAPMH